MAKFIGAETVEGVDGTGIGIIVLGVLFSSSTIIAAVLEGVVVGLVVVNGIMLVGAIVFCNFSLCELLSSSVGFFMLAFETMGEKGCRVRGDCMSRTLPAPAQAPAPPNDCFFTGTLAMSNPLRTGKKFEMQDKPSKNSICP